MENIRFILIVAFAMILYMLWEAWQVDYGPKPKFTTISETEIKDVKDVNDVKEDMPVAIMTENGSSDELEVKQPSESAVSDFKETSSQIIKVKTDVFSLEIDTQGGTLRNLDLLKYPFEKENPDVLVRLFDSSEEKLFLAQSGLIASSGSDMLPNHHTIFSTEQDYYELDADQNILRVALTWSNGQGMLVTKTYVFSRDSYVIKLEQKVNNNSDQDWIGRQYTQLLRIPYSDKKGNTFIRTYAGGVVYTEEDKYQKVEFSDMAEENLSVKNIGGWSAMTQHYFASAWVPPEDEENLFYTKELKNFRYVIGSYASPVKVKQNDEIVFKAQLYTGPKIQPIMEKVSPGLELTVDYGWLTIVGKPIYWLLNKIHTLVGNWGWSILGVTLCIKLLFFKLSEASYKSMAKMRKIQPRLKALKDKYPDDKQKFNSEMMAMYKKEKVNPLGGCFPILVQIPVFISLYWVLIETVELRQAPFALWIQDLSAQDPFYILPVIMGFTMFIQQSLNPAPVDPIQAKIMKMFPVMFTVFFLFFPAGLVLYWVMNNTLSIIQQWFITKSIEKAG